MPRITFSQLNAYFKNLGENHVDIQDVYRWNPQEFTGKMRSGVQLPVMLVDPVETHPSGDTTKTIHSNHIAFTVLGKPDTKTGKIDSYDAQDEVLDYCQNICFDLEARILYDATLPEIAGVKNWMYGLVDKNSFHHFKVGPVFVDGLYGYRTELIFKNTVPLGVDVSKFTDL